VFEVAAQLNVVLIETAVAPSEGDGLEGTPGVGHVVKDQTDPEVEFPQLFFATILQ